MRIVVSIVLAVVTCVSAQPGKTLRNLDEGRPWIVAGKGITVVKVGKEKAPP